MQQHAKDIEFEVGDPVLVLLGRGGNEWIEKAEVAVVREDRLILRLIDRPGKCFMPVHARYVMHVCVECGKEPAIRAGYVCELCHTDAFEAIEWRQATTPIYRFRYASPYLQTGRPVRGIA